MQRLKINKEQLSLNLILSSNNNIKHVYVGFIDSNFFVPIKLLIQPRFTVPFLPFPYLFLFQYSLALHARKTVSFYLSVCIKML